MGSNSKEFIEDRIGELPDDIRSHILSFLPTRDAVKTCVVSHRWRHAWVSVLNLDVLASSPGRSAGFVDRVLFFRGLNRILKLRLKGLGIKNYYSRIETWIHIAIRCNVVELDLDLLHFGISDQNVELPRSMFVCKTLVVLKMRLGPNVNAIPPTSGCFPSLKYLNVTFNRPRLIDSIEKLFASCPQLEDLIISGNLGSLGASAFMNLSAPKLRRLKLTLRASLVAKEYRFFIKANVPNLENLDLKENFFATYSWNAKSLKSAKVELESYHGHPIVKDFDKEFANRINSLFPDISGVRYLSLSARVLGYVDLKGRGYHLPKFNNLSQLELHHQSCCVLELLIKILNASPNLECLVYQNDDINSPAFPHFRKDLARDRYPPEAVPNCLSACLKSICIRGFKALKGEIDVAEYLLKHGQVLNTFTFHSGGLWDYSVMKFQQKCSKLERGSTSCKIQWIFSSL